MLTFPLILVNNLGLPKPLEGHYKPSYDQLIVLFWKLRLNRKCIIIVHPYKHRILLIFNKFLALVG